MMFPISAILSLVTTLGGGLITAYNKSKDVSITAIQSAVGIAGAQVQAMSLWIGHPLSPPAILAYAVALYYGKAIAYDNVISFWITGKAGFTPGLTGATAAVASVVIAGMFLTGYRKQ